MQRFPMRRSETANLCQVSRLAAAGDSCRPTPQLPLHGQQQAWTGRNPCPYVMSLSSKVQLATLDQLASPITAEEGDDPEGNDVQLTAQVAARFTPTHKQPFLRLVYQPMTSCHCEPWCGRLCRSRRMRSQQILWNIRLRFYSDSYANREHRELLGSSSLSVSLFFFFVVHQMARLHSYRTGRGCGRWTRAFMCL